MPTMFVELTLGKKKWFGLTDWECFPLKLNYI